MPWRVRSFRYSTAGLVDYRTKTDQAVSSFYQAFSILGIVLSLLAVAWLVILFVPGASEAFAAVPLLSGAPIFLWGMAIDPGDAWVLLFCLLLILIAIVVNRRNRPMARRPTRTEAVPFRERWPLIQWWVLDLNRWTPRRMPTSRWGSIAFAFLCALFALMMAWLLIAGHPDSPELSPWNLWLMLFLSLFGIFHVTWLRQLRRRWGDTEPPRWRAPDA
jgi:hypothetical protein